ncbi:MAG: hypothetical protein VKL00_03890 [Synechococcales bacterium]|nr:hypothetical protein [Cyanobacteria bacterium REEB444]MEB3124769.1 hypothetical protein [Synechococcales bacterium]
MSRLATMGEVASADYIRHNPSVTTGFEPFILIGAIGKRWQGNTTL